MSGRALRARKPPAIPPARPAGTRNLAGQQRVSTYEEARLLAKYHPRWTAANAVLAMAVIVRSHFGDEVAERRLRNLAFCIVHGGSMPPRRELRRIAGMGHYG